MGKTIHCDDTTSKKIYVSPQQVYDSSFELASMILESGFRPNVMFAVMRGGAPTANIVNEVLEKAGIETKFAGTLTKAYESDNKINHERIVKIGGYTLNPKDIYKGSKILLVEDTHDSGFSLSALIADMIAKGNDIKREDIKVAVMDYKELKFQEPRKEVKIRRLYENGLLNEIYSKLLSFVGLPDLKHRVHVLENSYFKPDFYVNKFVVTEKENSPWIWYPHELMGHTNKEISDNMGKIPYQTVMLADKVKSK